MAVLAENHPADAHGHGEQAGPREIAPCFAQADGGFGKGGSPLGHGQLRGPGADHQHDGRPEQGLSQQAPDAQSPALLHQMLDGAGGEVIDVVKGQQRPDAGQPLPAVDAEHREEEGGQHHHPHASPAVEGVEQAHDGLLVLEGAGLHNGAAQHLNEAAADGVEKDTEQYSREGVGENLRQQRQPQKPCRGADLRGHDAPAVADAVHEPGAQEVHNQLGQEKRGGNQGDAPQGDGIIAVEFQKQQRREVGANGLGDEA